MNITELFPIIIASIASALISVAFTFYWVKKSGEGIASSINGFLEARDEALEAQLKPILNTNSRVMGIIADKGNTQKQEKIALKTLGNDLLGQNEVVIEALRGIAPGFSDYLEEHPDLVIKLMPRIDALLEKQGGIEGILTGVTGKSPLSPRHSPHPFWNREE